MKKIIMMFLTIVSFCTQISFALANVEELNMTNYMFKLNSAPIAVVSFAITNPTDDYNSRLRQNMRDATEFYQYNPFIKFFSVNVFQEPMLVRALGIRKFPTVAIYKYGEKVDSREGLIYLDELMELIETNQFNE
jgi:hypothetical protein